MTEARLDSNVKDAPISEPAQLQAEAIIFGTLTARGMDTMTEGGVEFVLCASALTAQM